MSLLQYNTFLLWFNVQLSPASLQSTIAITAHFKLLNGIKYTYSNDNTPQYLALIMFPFGSCYTYSYFPDPVLKYCSAEFI